MLFGDNWVDITIQIQRPGVNDYQLRAWWDIDFSEMFEHPDELFIDDLLALEPGIFVKRYNLRFDPRNYSSRFRLTYDPLDPEVLPSGEFYSATDCSAVNAAAGNCVSHGEVEDYAPVPAPFPIFGVCAAYSFSRRLRNRIKGRPSGVH